MATNYDKNQWELFDPEIPYEEQPHSFITKRKLDKMEQGIYEANVGLEIGKVSMGDAPNLTLTRDEDNNIRKLNITFPPAGKGDPGKSAYETWLENGHTGTEQEFIDHIKGIDGKDGKDGKDGADGAPGPQGESAYQTWIAMGNTGSESDFLNSLKGIGKSTYDVWLELGNTGTPQEFLDTLKGDNGKDGRTPIKGVDYYTDAEKAEIVNLVIKVLQANKLI